MTFWLKKIVAWGLMPLSLCLGLIVAGLALTWSSGRARLGRWLAFAGVALLFILSNHFVAEKLTRPLETRYPAATDASFVGSAPAAIVILGAGYGVSPARPALGQLTWPATARLAEGVRLARVLPEAKLIVCGPDLGNGVTHASQLAAAAESLGVAPARIVQMDRARDTEAEARLIKDLVGTQRIALVTSALHLPRAVALFRGAGMSVVPCPAGFATQSYDTFGPEQFLCDAGSLAQSSAALHERIGLLWSSLRGRTK